MDGKQLYYRTLDNRYMEVDLTLGAKIEAAAPRVMGSSSTTVPTSAGDPTRHMWSVAADGRCAWRSGPGAAGGGAGSAPGLLNPAFTPGGRSGDDGGGHQKPDDERPDRGAPHWMSVLSKENK